jgi:ribosomal protein S18 acetylase RimI-like enzyme
MDHAEALLLERGCPKVNLQVRGDNAEVVAFYEQRGYRLEPASHAVTLALRLVEDGPQP